MIQHAQIDQLAAQPDLLEPTARAELIAATAWRHCLNRHTLAEQLADRRTR